MAFIAGFSHERYWSEFEVQDADLDVIYNLLLERERPLTTREMALALIEHRIRQLEREAQQASEQALAVYLPSEDFRVGQKLAFPALGNAVGTVVGVREGQNPDLGEFGVIQVEIEGDGNVREFACRLPDHPLNERAQMLAAEEDISVEAILERYGQRIEERLTARLQASEDIVRIAGRWFPKSLLADINEGHLNLAEAVLDVAGGGPLPTSALLEHIELPSHLDPLLAEFSLDYALQEDERFDEVGPAGQVLWFLKRLEPPEVLYTPPRLEYVSVDHDRSVLTEDLLALEEQLDDELSPLPPLKESMDEVVLALLFPHWRVGALPLSRRLEPLFPTAYEAPRIRFILVDGHSGEKFPGWVVREQRYVFGLDEFYRKYQVPAGGLVRVRRGEEPGEVIVEVVDRRTRNEWIRTISIGEGRRIGFTMLKQPVGAAYDDLMVLGLIDPVALDEAWLRGEQRKMPIDRLVAHVFRELAKLNPQSAVHAQALYSAVNVIRRLPPAPIFAELVTRPYYMHVGDLYWRFDDSAWSSA
jgi:hypothetical protein